MNQQPQIDNSAPHTDTNQQYLIVSSQIVIDPALLGE